MYKQARAETRKFVKETEKAIATKNKEARDAQRKAEREAAAANKQQGRLVSAAQREAQKAKQRQEAAAEKEAKRIALAEAKEAERIALATQKAEMEAQRAQTAPSRRQYKRPRTSSVDTSGSDQNEFIPPPMHVSMFDIFR